MFDSVSNAVNNFSSQLSGGVLAWYIFVLVCLLVLAKSHLIVKILCWFPLILTVCYIVFSNGINSGTQRSKFFNNLSIGSDISSTNVKGNRRNVLDHALYQHDAIMFSVQMDEQGALVVSNEEPTRNIEDEDRGKTLFLNETMEACRSKHARVVINVLQYHSDLLDEVISYVKKYDLLSDVVVTSSNPLVPLSIKKKESRILTGLSYSLHGITSYFAKSYPNNLFYKYVGQFFDGTKQFVTQNFVLPKFVGSDVLFMDQSDISLNFIKAAASNSIKVVGIDVNNRGEEKWMTNVAKIPYFTNRLN